MVTKLANNLEVDMLRAFKNEIFFITVEFLLVTLNFQK